MSKPRALPVFLVPAALVMAGALFAAAASAGTWQWRDASGRMVYSDLPPPPEVRASQIVRAPASAPLPAANAAADTAASEAGAGDAGTGTRDAPHASTAGATATPRSWVEKEAESRKRALEREEAGRKEQEQRNQAARVARACEQSRTSLRLLESGMRTATITASGERAVLDEHERARRIDELRSDIARDCARPG